ncbi:MAG: hypothetical protein NVS2B9_04300 [Myxococcales bacterium]
MQNPTRSFAKFLSAAALAASLTPGVSSAAAHSLATTVWVAPPTQKIRPNVRPPAGATTVATLSAAKNEFQSFQVVVTGWANNVSLSLSNLSDGRGHTISGRDIVLYREALANVWTPAGGDGASGLWPDALIPDVDPIVGEKRNAFPFSVPGNESRAVLVDIHVPYGARAGMYTGTLKVTGSVWAQIPVRLTVWNFAIPSTATLRSAFGMLWNGPCLGHGDSQCRNMPAERALRGRYVQAALDNRFSIDEPELGSPVAANGRTNWPDFDRSVGPFLDGSAPTRLQGARLTSIRTLSPGGPPYTSRAAARAWGRHFRDQGWLPVLYNLVCDEPPIQCAFRDINQRIAESKAGDWAIPTVVTTSSTRGRANNIKGVDLYAPVINWLEDKPDMGGYTGPQRHNYGGQMWWYQSCMSHGCNRPGGWFERKYFTGWPTLQVDADGSRYRSQQWLSFTYGISGIYYYETMQAAAKNPWVNNDQFGAHGDGSLFYPGTPNRIGGRTEIPIESLRMKGIRDGEQDYELLVLAQRAGHGAEARRIALSVFPRAFQGQATPQQIAWAREQLARLITR